MESGDGEQTVAKFLTSNTTALCSLKSPGNSYRILFDCCICVCTVWVLYVWDINFIFFILILFISAIYWIIFSVCLLMRRRREEKKVEKSVQSVVIVKQEIIKYLVFKKRSIFFMMQVKLIEQQNLPVFFFLFYILRSLMLWVYLLDLVWQQHVKLLYLRYESQPVRQNLY